MISEKMAGMVYGFEQAIVLSIADGGHKNVTDKWKESCARLIDEIAELESARAWRPIDTAPKDGQLILTYNNVTGEEIQWADDDIGRYHMPTHWMPLPEPPA